MAKKWHTDHLTTFPIWKGETWQKNDTLLDQLVKVETWQGYHRPAKNWGKYHRFRSKTLFKHQAFLEKSEIAVRQF